MKTTKNYLLVALLVPGMMLTAGGALAGAHDNDNDRGADAMGDQEATYMTSKPAGAFHADDLIGTDVKSTAAEDEEIGSITDLIISEDGEVKGVIVSVGGFVGVGDKDVAIAWDELELTKDDDGDYVVRVDATEEALEGAPEYEKD